MAGRILIVDDLATNRIVLKVRLAGACYQTALAATAAECLHHIQKSAPDLVILDRMLPDLDGIEVLRRLRADPATRDLPVIVTVAADDQMARLEALRDGADDVMAKPLDEMRLMARLRSLLRARAGVQEMRARDATLGAVGMTEAGAPFERPGLVALVAARPETALHLRGLLAGQMAEKFVLLSREEALADATQVPDAYLIEADPGGEGGGLRLMSELRSRSSGRHAAICMLLPRSGAGAEAMALDLGAHDVIVAGTDPCEIALRLRRLVARKHAADRMRETVTDGLRLAVIDPLTGLHNRRYALAQLGRMLDSAHRSGAEVAAMVIDLDRFKTVNDAFGHAAGDAALIEVARRLAANLRSTDLLARIGGEEFLVALPETSLAEARQMAERLCRAVEEAPIRFERNGGLTLTVSIGLAAFAPAQPGDRSVVAALVDSADQALLKAKAQGRNQVTICQPAA